MGTNFGCADSAALAGAACKTRRIRARNSFRAYLPSWSTLSGHASETTSPHDRAVLVREAARRTVRVEEREALRLRVVEEPIRFVDRVQGQSKMSAKIFAEALRVVWQLRAQVERPALGSGARADCAAE